MSRRSTTAVAEHPAPKAEPVDDFIASLETLSRSVRRLPAKRLARKLSAEGASAQVKVLRRLADVARQVEELRLALQSDEIGHTAEGAKRSADHRLGEMRRAGELLEPAELVARLHWTRQALSKALAARRVFFVEHEGARYYPSFFADPKYERRQIEAVSKALGDLPGGAKLAFMTTPKASLEGRTPLEALAAGEVSAAKAAAEAARVR
jgi:hypothetical protein